MEIKNAIMEENSELLKYMDEVMPEKSDTELQEILDVNIELKFLINGRIAGCGSGCSRIFI